MKRLLVLVVFLMAVVPASFAQEVLNITTYYPSPNGVYRTLRLFPINSGIPVCNAANEGVMYMDSVGSNHYVKFCHNAGGTYQWVNQSIQTNCQTVTCASSTSCSCPAGYSLTGGGCGQGGASVALYESYPSGEQTWNCRGAGTVTTSVRCCR